MELLKNLPGCEMALAHRRHRFTVAEYFALEEKSDVRHEFLNGEIYDMAGTNAAHDRIMINLIHALENQLLEDAPCQLHTSEMQVQVDAEEHYAYPDLTAVCGTPKYKDEQERTLLNPTLLVEIASPSTAKYDRSGKLEQYQNIATFEDYLLIAHDEMRVTHYRRNPDKSWPFMAVIGAESVLNLTSIGCKLALKQIYRRVQFSPPVPPSA